MSNFIDENGSLSDPYKNFIALSRYARWDDELNRRETWTETVDRYSSFFQEYLDTKYPLAASEIDMGEITSYIKNHKVMPSMRSLMTAGPALQRCNVGSYNCSFLGVDSLRSFDEAMYILMCGTGVGFSVESKYVDKLPVINEHFESSETTIVVGDSKAGWARALRELLSLLQAGQIPAWDVSKVRPAGARLKTFGGRASGPEPLERLFKFCVEVFKGAAGRKLKPIEAHDIMCKIGEIVVVGGVRRSAMISLSNLEDYDMAKAKSGSWWDTNGQRALANNSAVYESKPGVGEFLKEWRHLYESKSGERGIFSLENAQRTASATGRDGSKVMGTNPSLVPGTLVWTDGGIREIQDLEGENFYVRNLNGQLSQATCWKSGEDKIVYEVSLAGGHKYYATEEHKWPVLIDGVWTRTKTTDLKPGDKLKNTLHHDLFHGTDGTYDEGFLIGWNLGDGWQTSRESGLQIGFMVSEDDRAHGNIDEKITKTLASLGSTSELITKDEINVNNAALRTLFAKYGVKHKSEGLPLAVWDSSVSDSFRKGLIDGLLSADGSVNVADGRISFVQKSEKMIDDVSALLGFFGVQSHKRVQMTTGRKAFGWKDTYSSEDKEFKSHVLRIGGLENIQHFASLFSFSRTDKQQKLIELSSRSRSKGVSANTHIEIVSVLEYGTSDVWDISVNDETHAFRLSHAVTGNCGEILLRSKGFCNLSEVIVDKSDTLETLKDKVRVATIIGTIQSAMTDFKYLRKAWKDNAEEERLLGVSLTGQFGHEVLSGSAGHEKLRLWLTEMKQVAIETNRKYAELLGINMSAAITTVKPSGTVSQLTGVASGMHPWHSQQYIRSVRGDNKDPLTQFLIHAGIPSEPEYLKPLDTTVFYFPVKAPDGSITRNDISAIEHLEIWKVYKDYWTEHNPSITVTVRDEEWVSVAAWVYDNWSSVGGISFLPHSDHTYRQAPYQEISKEEFEKFLEAMPDHIHWDELSFYETEDATTGSQELSCVAGACDVIEIGSVDSVEQK